VVPVAVRPAKLVCPEMLAAPFTAKVVPGVAVATPKTLKSPVYPSALIPPPVKVNPPEEEREPTTNPPVKVEVAVFVFKSDPPEIVNPPLVCKPLVPTITPDSKDDDAVEAPPTRR